MHKKTKGEVAELYVAAFLKERGWRILFPVGENQRYDLVIERGGRFLRLQIKYVSPRKGVLKVNCRSSNNWSVLHYSKKEIDVIAAFNAEDKNIYFIPVNKINRTLFNLRLACSKNNQKLKIHSANQFRNLD